MRTHSSGMLQLTRNTGSKIQDTGCPAEEDRRPSQVNSAQVLRSGQLPALAAALLRGLVIDI